MRTRGTGAVNGHREENKELTCGRHGGCKRFKIVIKILKTEVDALLFEK